jgi:hypothetical protein
MDLLRKSELVKERIENLQLPDGSSPSYCETCGPGVDTNEPLEYVHRFVCGTAGGGPQTMEVRVSESGIDILYHDHGSCNVQILGSADKVETALEEIMRYLKTRHNSSMKQKK